MHRFGSIRTLGVTLLHPNFGRGELSMNKFELESNKAEILEELERREEKALFAMGLEWLRAATTIATERYTSASGGVGVVDTGRFRASLSFVTPEQQDGGAPVAESESGDQLRGTAPEKSLIVGSDVEYAQYLELGTAKMGARPVVGPAVQENAQRFKQLTQEILKDG